MFNLEGFINGFIVLGVIAILICSAFTLGIGYKIGYNNGQKDLLNGKVKYEQVIDTTKIWKITKK